MAFGKRTGFGTVAAPAPSAENPHGQRKIIPDEAWEGKTGDFLRELDFDPNDASNLVPNADAVNARNERDKAVFDEKLARFNIDIGRRTNGGAVRGFSLLPDPCWNGEMGHLLMLRLELFPYEDWNMALLPADVETALALNAPPHPGGDIPAFVESSAKFLKDADAALRAAHDEATRTQDYAKFNDSREAIRNKIKNLASAFYASMAEAWNKNKPQPH